MNKIFKMYFLYLIFVNSVIAQQPNDILPVQLIYFEAQLTYGGILLRWGTATELNNFGFEVQRADSSWEFIGIDFVPGSGTSNSPKHYFYLDTTLTGFGWYHYRLKQIDINGPFHYSDTVHILYQTLKIDNKGLQGKEGVLILNDLMAKELTIKFEEKLENEISLAVFSILGQKIFEQKLSPNQWLQKLSYAKFSSGVYFIVVTSGNKLYLTHKFIAIH